MTLKCQNCGKELPDSPKKKVVDGEMDEIVAHTQLEDSPGLFTEATTDYYCDLECASEGGGGS